MESLRKIIPVFILAVFGVVIFYFCDNTIYRNDDVRYEYLFTEQHHTLDHDYDEFNDRLGSIGDIINSQEIHYQNVNGRFVAHCIVQYVCCFMDQRAFAITNAIVSILLILIVLGLGCGTLKSIPSLLTTVLLVTLSMMTRMSPAYQINYTWMFLFTLVFVYMFFRYKDNKNIFILIGLAIFSAVAGNGHEGINVGIGGALIVYWLSNFKKCTMSQYIMAICFGCGLLILCLAPANFVRLNNEGPVDVLGALTGMLYSFRSVYVLFIIVMYKKLWGKFKFSQIYVNNSFFWNAMIISIIFIFVCGAPGRRSVLGIEILSVILIIRLLKNHAFDKLWLFVASMLLVCLWTQHLIQTAIIKKQYNQILEQYSESKTGKVYTNKVMSECYDLFDRPYVTVPFNSYSNEKSVLSFQKALHTYFTPDKPLVVVLPD